MLNSSSVVIATNLADIVVSQGLTLVPKNMTLLSELNKAINGNMFNGVINDRGFIEPSIVGASTGNTVSSNGVQKYEQSPHDTFMDNYINDLSTLVSGHVSYARSVVNKEVTLLKEAIAESLSSYQYKEPESFFSVKYFKLNDIYNSMIVETEIKNYLSNTTRTYPETFNSISKLTDTEFFNYTSYVMTGDEEQDIMIKSWIGGLGEEKIINNICNKVNDYEMSNDQVLDYALSNYLFYRNLTIKTDLDFGYSLTSLRTLAAANRDHFGSMLAVAIEQYRKDIRNGRVLTTNSNMAFSYFNDRPLEITVLEESFAKLAEAGGGIEVIFGYITSNSSNDINVDNLIANKEDYLKQWGNTRSLYLISLNSSRLGIFKQLLRQTFDQSLTSTEEGGDEDQYLKSHTGHLEETKQLGYAYIDQIHASDMEDIECICLELVANIRYRFTNAYYLLKEMQEIMKMSDKIEPMEAALYATSKYIVDFLLDQVDVVRS